VPCGGKILNLEGKNENGHHRVANVRNLEKDKDVAILPDLGRQATFKEQKPGSKTVTSSALTEEAKRRYEE